MTLLSWILIYLIDLIFWVWIVKWGGAEWLEGTIKAEFLISIFASRWSVEGIKLFGYGIIIISTIIFILGIFISDFRQFL